MSKIVRKSLTECKVTPARKQKLAELANRPDWEDKRFGYSRNHRRLLEKRCSQSVLPAEENTADGPAGC